MGAKDRAMTGALVERHLQYISLYPSKERGLYPLLLSYAPLRPRSGAGTSAPTSDFHFLGECISLVGADVPTLQQGAEKSVR